MADPNLTESAWQRATADAGRIYPTTAFEVAAALMTIIFGAIAAVVSGGGIIRSSADAPGAEEWTNRIVELLSEHVDANAAREFIEAPKNVNGFKERLDAQTRALDRIIDGLNEG